MQFKQGADSCEDLNDSREYGTTFEPTTKKN